MIVLDDNGKAALQRYLDLGGNFVGIHSASDALRTTPFYGNEVGESRTSILAHLSGPDILVRGILRLSSGAAERGERCRPTLGSGVVLNHASFALQTVDVIDSSHPSTSMLPTEWHVQDEMYVTL